MSKLDEILEASRLNHTPPVKLGRTVYFDETNNIRKGIMEEGKDNNPELEYSFFVLGGIATKDALDFDDLLRYIGARQVPADAKYDFFVMKHRSFETAIKQSRFRKLLEYLHSKDVLIHFASLHYYHFAIADILNSLIEEKDVNQYVAFEYYLLLQSDMTEVLFRDYDKAHEFLYKYNFPNIPKGQANNFIKDLYCLYERNLMYYNDKSIDYFTKEMLRQIIKAKLDKSNLIFLEGNKDHVISEKMTTFYLIRSYHFNDRKIFDHELVVEEDLKNMDPDYERKMGAVFRDSKDCREIQVSDAISGFVGKLYSFLIKNDERAIMDFVSGLADDSESLRTLKTFFSIIARSDKASSGICFFKTSPLFVERRFNLLLRLVESH